MKTMCMTVFVCLLASAGELPQLEGEVVSTAIDGPGTLWAQLVSLDGGGIARTLVGQDGRFLFIPPPAGTYTLRIVDATGRELASQPVNVRNEDQRVTIQLPEPTAAA